ncbi:MAG: flagellar hook-length control protein FliK [Deltaproteobacteria bacterium]|nr:flagellar hook-length control protein FliK [Deltaproteobacteria bacterium]
MNISQTGQSPQKNATSDSQQVTSGITDSEVFLDQLNLAKQGTEWYMETGVKSDKERMNEEQQVKRKQTEDLEQAKRRQTEDLEREQIVGMTSQAYIEQLRQSSMMESARVVSDVENQAQTLKHVEKKHLHTPAVVKDGENGKADIFFNKIMTGEMDGAKKGNLAKESATISANLESDETRSTSRSPLVKPGETANGELMQRFDASMIRGLNTPASAKTGARTLDKGLPELSKIAANQSSTGKNAGKNGAAKITSFSNINADTSLSNRRSEIGIKADGNSGKGAEPVNIKDVVGNVKFMISSKTNEMVMKLAPEHLGKMEIKLRKEGDKLTGRFKVDSQQAKEAIESKIPQLKEALAEHGVHVEEFTVIINGEDDSNGAFAFNQGHEGDAGQSSDTGTSENESRLNTQTAENTTNVSSRNTSGLNIYA